MEQSQDRTLAQKIGLPLAFAVLFAIIMLPTQEGLTVAGQRMLALLVFSVILWMTEAVSYAVSAWIILAVMTLLLGFSPSVAKPEVNYTMNQALVMGLGGLANSAWALVAAALFISAAMQKTGLDTRIALKVMQVMGAKTSRILLGVILVGFILSFFVPSTTARVACIIPIIMGIIKAFGVDPRSKFAGLLTIACAQIDSIWNVGIKTAAAQNMIATNFIKQILDVEVSWLDWFIAAAPFAAVMSVVLYFIMLKVMPPEVKEIEGGNETIRKELNKLGPLSKPELKLVIMSCILLAFWVLEGKTWGLLGFGGAFGSATIHPFNTASITIVAVAAIMTPGIGVMDWKYAQGKINWGTLILFGIGISLGSAIITTQAGQWLARAIVPAFGLADSSHFFILAVMALFLIIIHMGFASATALAAALIPIIISVFQEINTHQLGTPINIVGMTMILQFVISFGFILPANAPQNMIAYGTDTFTPKDFIRTGIPLTIAAYLGILVFAATYWRWLGIVN